QGFQYREILAAHRDAHAAGEDNLTDDAAVAERAGLEVTMIPGRPENKKLTTADDISAADAMLRRADANNLPDVRVGQGVDLHAFESGNRVILCGIEIPYDRKLKGHSDADVAMHALTDAIFGAVGESDIGQHFPPSDARWKNANSEVFLIKALSSIQSRGGLIANVDVTIIAEAPRIGPHVAKMKENLSRLLGIGVDRIAIKATTAERLGAVGRGEGIMAMATATVRLP
ncbi:MAG: 2-C-methyl-D-erythritol 2,4-cyclodiphosphate synthase, partial [Alphaproteobacteria bacterium]|nr:2-C-methyl-D-erythritol 2,4-cyclodiphosphate synthase [Alphaproteobacteria bacterium]